MNLCQHKMAHTRLQIRSLHSSFSLTSTSTSTPNLDDFSPAIPPRDETAQYLKIFIASTFQTIIFVDMNHLFLFSF
ncbi:hypothetical protein EAF04_006939 [Stromatinia cepivora]|nr:hypothetical protein EAF04_006939 [Stromatinia cepivora]